MILHPELSSDTNIIADEYGKRIHAYPILPKDMTLKEISYIKNEIEVGNYNIATLNDVKVRKR